MGHELETIEQLARVRGGERQAASEYARATDHGLIHWWGSSLRLAIEIEPAPLILTVAGTPPNPKTPRVAVVGSRRASAAGRRIAYRLGRELAQLGMDVVSGLAKGIDAAALEGALAAGGSPCAVLGNGLPRVYPAENAALAKRISTQGAVLSEFPLDAPPRRHHFPQRNRLISGLSLAVVVVEAAARSGSLITARWALDQGREVMAFPGCAEGPSHEGCHQLIRDGAPLVTSAEDVILELGGALTIDS